MDLAAESRNPPPVRIYTGEDNDGNDAQSKSGSEFSSISEANSLEQALAESLRTDVPGTEAEIRALIRVDDEPWEQIQQQASASSTTEPPRSPGEAE